MSGVTWHDGTRRAPHLCGILSINYNPSPSVRKNIRQTQTGGHYVGWPARAPPPCQGYEKQGETEKLPQPGGDHEEA